MSFCSVGLLGVGGDVNRDLQSPQQADSGETSGA